MKKAALGIAALFMMFNAYGQEESPEYKAVVSGFVNFYNASQPEEIFNMFTPEMRQAMPLQRANDFFSGLKMQLGKIREGKFIKFQEPFAVYRIHFERGVFALNIAVAGASRIAGFSITPYSSEKLPEIGRTKTQMILPFRGEWTVVWGGDTEELNYHVVSDAQKHAFDFVIRDETGKSCAGPGSRNEDFYCFGKELLAPCEAVVVTAVDGVRDNKPGDMDPFFTPGNTVILQTAHGEYLYLCHFKKHSIRVKEGQKVQPGDLLGLCGNSGNSSKPHLHFHVQNTDAVRLATGIKCYFEKLVVNQEVKSDYSPIQKDRIRNCSQE